MRPFYLVSALALLFGCGDAPRSDDGGTDALSATEVVARSMSYHDPGENWPEAALQLKLSETNPSRTRDRHTTLDFRVADGYFHMVQPRPQGVIEAWSDNAGRCEATLDGGPLPDSLARDLRLTCTDGKLWWRDYYVYMHGLPMKLTDPGTTLDQRVERVDFGGQDALRVRAAYSPEVGSDVWYFYFAPDTYRLLGSRFYHDEMANDGEVILFEGEVETAGIRTAEVFRWFYNRDSTYIGGDSIMTFLSVAPESE